MSGSNGQAEAVQPAVSQHVQSLINAQSARIGALVTETLALQLNIQGLMQEREELHSIIAKLTAEHPSTPAEDSQADTA